MIETDRLRDRLRDEVADLKAEVARLRERADRLEFLACAAHTLLAFRGCGDADLSGLIDEFHRCDAKPSESTLAAVRKLAGLDAAPAAKEPPR